jgi:hypothetical protein
MYSAEDPVKRIKREAIERKKISANHIFDKGLVSRMYRELSKFSNKNQKKLGMVAQACNPSIWKTEAGGSQVQGQPGLYSQTLLQFDREQK